MIRERYPREGATVVAAILGRTWGATACRARHLGVARAHRFTPAQDAILRARYPLEGPALAEELGHPKLAVIQRASRLGVSRLRRYTPEEDERIREEWGEGRDVLGRLSLELGRSACSIYERATHDLGLARGGAPQGYEFFTGAADRTGFSRGQLLAILRRFEKPFHLAASPSGCGKRHLVCPADVDEAVAAWLKLEVVGTAAERLGLARDTLRTWLLNARAAGEDVPEPPSAYRWWRVPSEIIERVVAQHTSRLPLKRAAAMLGVPFTNARTWCLAAGMRPVRPGHWRVTLDEVQNVVAQRRAKETS